MTSPSSTSIRVVWVRPKQQSCVALRLHRCKAKEGIICCWRACCLWHVGRLPALIATPGIIHDPWVWSLLGHSIVAKRSKHTPRWLQKHIFIFPRWERGRTFSPVTSSAGPTRRVVWHKPGASGVWARRRSRGESKSMREGCWKHLRPEGTCLASALHCHMCGTS